MKTVTANERISAALELAHYYGQMDGAHHRLWVIDQMVRALTGDEYDQWIREVTTDERGNNFGYEWDTGVMP